MDNLLDELKELLQQDERLVVDGKLLKNKVVELGLQLDPMLIKLLLSRPSIKKHFFQDVDGILVFDKVKFQKFISNKAFLPDSYTSFKNKIGLLANDEYLTESKEVVLAWPYKECILEGGQTKEDVKREEVFWNETLAPDEIDRLLDPKVLTNFKRYDKDGEHKVTDITIDDNLIVKGNNLLALHSLKKVYEGKIKVIYIDPPYNTGNDSFNYNDSFNHSTWLTFIKNRLEIARKLLAKDGFIFISCDDNEQAYLKVICDDIFKRENFIAQIIVQSNKRGQTYQQIAKTHEYLLVYSKSDLAEIKELEKEGEFKLKDDIGGYELRELRNRNPKFGRFNRPNLFFPIFVNPNAEFEGYYPISLERDDNFTLEILPYNRTGGESCWRWGKEKVHKNFNLNLRISNIVAKKKTTGEFGIYEKYRKQTYKAKTIWVEKEVISEQGTMELGELGLATQFDFPKPSYLIKKILQLASDHDSIILDFCAGSGTTAHAVLDLNKEDGGNRKFILVEQLDYIENATLERTKRVMAGNHQNVSFLYLELMQWNERYAKKILAAQDSDVIQSVWQEMRTKANLSYRLDLRRFNEAAKDFSDLSLEEQKRFLMEVLDKNQLYVNLSEMDDETYGISDDIKSLNRKFYNLR